MEIGAYTVVEADVEVGENSWIGNHVNLRSGAHIGKRCKIYHSSVIGEVPQDLKFEGEESTAILGDEVIIREFVTVNRGTKALGKTIVGNKSYLMAYVHVAHDCTIGNNVIMANAIHMGGHVEIGDWAILGGGVLVHQFTKIGAHAMIGGGYRAVQDVPPYIMAAGEPLKFSGINAIGLRRRGFSGNTRKEIKAAYRLLFRSKMDKDEAVWFHGTKVGRDNDRVLIKKTGEPTYRLPDMAYHINKIERGYNLCIDIFGADHMDAYPDVIEVVKQLGYNQSKIKVLIHQFISILKNGKQIKMSTRKATFITLDELINEVGIDVVRYFFIMRNINSHLNFDLEVAKEKSEKNPIYYIQYAYARIMTIQTFVDYSYSNADLALLDSDEEIKIISKLFEFEELILKLSEVLEPQLLATYLFELATMFHKYYAKFRIINKNKELSKSRLVLIDAVSTVIKNGLNILGISSPKTM